MKIKKLKLNNFRAVNNLVFDFQDQLNLFVGINGSGKSTVLDALAICLSWLIKRIESESGRGFSIQDQSIRNDQGNAYLELCFNGLGNDYSWTITKTAKGKLSDYKTVLEDLNKLAELIKKQHEQNTSWPVIAYYPINRIVGAIKPEIPNRSSSYYNLDVYENALGVKANYQSFFEWFRLQDDILNENAQSRSKWMTQNKTWIKKRVNRLVALLKKISAMDEKPFQNEELKFFMERFEKDEMIYEEPRFLFRELSHITDFIAMRAPEHHNYERIFHDLDFMFHKMSAFNREFRDDLIEEGGIPAEMFDRFIRGFIRIQQEEKLEKNLIAFLWESFIFAILISLWWLTEKSKRDIEHELKLILTFSQKEPFDHNLISEKFSNTLQGIIKKEIQQKKNGFRKEGLELKVVATAIEKFIPDYKNLSVKRVPHPHMMIDKKGEPFNLDQLSDGEKNLIALVGDIARRLAIANPKLKNPLAGEGIILIDEIDLHLHPSWQRLIIPQLLETFPNCQFFISTHSPQVVSHVIPDNIFIMHPSDKGLEYNKPIEAYGMSIDRIVELIMDDEARPDIIQSELDRLFELIERERFEEAQQLIASLKKHLKTDPELLRAEILIKRKSYKK